MDGGVAVHSQPEQGFFHMPKLQLPTYQKSRVFIPFNQNIPPPNHGGGPGQADHRFKAPTGTTLSMPLSTSETGNVHFDGKRMRKAVVRKTVDYNTSVVKYLENRVWQRDGRDARAIQPDGLYQLDVTPPSNMQQKPMNSLTTKFMRQSTNKFRCPIFCLAWTPEGRRLVTGASSGEFTLWNGLTFSFETILQAHETSVRAMQWSHNDQWMVTGDHAGYLKYWQSNMNNVKMYQGHKEAIRDLSFCPSDSKFASCSDDGTVRVWDFLRCYEERTLRGHGADVKCVAWHPQKSLIASGSKDNQVPINLWDPKSDTRLATLHAHKFTVMDIAWNKNGNWLLTAARDHLMKLFDIRNLKEEVQIFKGHKKEATSVAWHPINEQMFASGGSDGAIMFWNAGTEKEVGSMEEAHDAIIWDLAWHPLGHVLASASNDHSTKFWTRNRPGDAMRDKYNLNIVALGPDGEALDIDADTPLGDGKSLLPGMGLEHGLPPVEEEKPKKIAFSNDDELPSIPGLDWSADVQYFREQQVKVEERPRKKTPFARPIPRSFEQAWITNQQPGTLVKDENDGLLKRGKIQSLLSLELPDKPPPGLEYVDLDHNGAEEEEERRPVEDKTETMQTEYSQGYGAGDQDYRSDQDYRQDQDHRADQDYRGNESQEYNRPAEPGYAYKNDSNSYRGSDQGGGYHGNAPPRNPPGYHGDRDHSGQEMYEKEHAEGYEEEYVDHHGGHDNSKPHHGMGNDRQRDQGNYYQGQGHDGKERPRPPGFDRGRGRGHQGEWNRGGHSRGGHDRGGHDRGGHDRGGHDGYRGRGRGVNAGRGFHHNKDNMDRKEGFDGEEGYQDHHGWQDKGPRGGGRGARSRGGFRGGGVGGDIRGRGNFRGRSRGRGPRGAPY